MLNLKTKQDCSIDQNKEIDMSEDTKTAEKMNISYGEKQLFSSPLMAAVNLKAAIKKLEAEKHKK